ncbi:MAG: sulfite exporter TauE/SafE family protein [Rhodospirillaceae bacterium]
MTPDLALGMAIAACAGLMRGFAGVGSGMLMAPFFAHLYGPAPTVGIIILMEVVVTAQLLPSTHRLIQWRTIAPMGAAAALAMPVGNWLLPRIEVAALQFGIAALVTLTAVLLLTGWRYDGRKPLAATLGIGAASGVLMSLTSLGNPPVMFYLLSSRDDAATNRANFTGYFAVTLAALIAVKLAAGQITGDIVTTAALLLPGFVLAVWIGAKLFRKSNETLYRRVALTILLAAGGYGMLR